MSREYRKNIRVSCSIPVLLRVALGEPQEAWGVIYDVSLGGIKLETRRALKHGDTVFLSFLLTDNFTFDNTRGKVKRVTGQDGYYTVGVEFDLVVDKIHLRDGMSAMFNTGHGLEKE